MPAVHAVARLAALRSRPDRSSRQLAPLGDGMKLTLPWPPSVNHYTRAGSRPGFRYLTDEAKSFRRAVSLIVGAARAREGMTHRLKVLVIASPPDKRERDLDNLHKGLLDALQHAGVYEKDSQIDDLHIVRGPVIKGGQVEVTIQPAGDLYRVAMREDA